MRRKYNDLKYNRRRSSDEDLCCCHKLRESRSKEYTKNVQNRPVNTNTFCPTFNPSITVNVPPAAAPASIGVETVQYMAFAKEDQYVYTNEDALKQYGSSDILNPNNVSNINLFVNGVLQPPSIYEVEEGILRLKSSDLPPNEAPIILLFVIISNDTLIKPKKGTN